MHAIVPTKSLLDQLDCFGLAATSVSRPGFHLYDNVGVASLTLLLEGDLVWAVYAVTNHRYFREYWEMAEWMESLDKNPE